MTEHDKAIQESERNAAASEYFKARPFFAAARESERIFDAGFDLGWAAHARQPRNFCPDCGQRTPVGSVHTCSPQSPLARLAAMPSAEKEAVMLRVIDRANSEQQAVMADADQPRRFGYLRTVRNGDPLIWDEGTRAVGVAPTPIARLDADSWGAGIKDQPLYKAEQEARNKKARAALDDMPCAQPDADGWIPWAGGHCPVGANTCLDVRFRDGESRHGVLAQSFGWRHENEGDDIVAYRIAKDAT